METLDLRFPESWEDISSSQLKFIAKIGLKELTREEFLLKLLCKFTGLKVEYIPEELDSNTDYCFTMPKKHFWNKKKLLFIPISTIVEACQKFEYVIDQIGILNLSPIKGVSNKLYDIQFEHYYFCDSLISRYQSTQDKKHLKKAVSELTGKRCLRIEKRKAYMIIIWWNGVRKFLTEKYPYVFSSDGSGSDSSPIEVYIQLLSIINNNRPDANKAIAATDLHSVFISLNNKLEAYDKQRVSS